MTSITRETRPHIRRRRRRRRRSALTIATPRLRCARVAGCVIGNDVMLVASGKQVFGGWMVDRYAVWSDSALLELAPSPAVGTRLPLGVDSDRPTMARQGAPCGGRAHLTPRIWWASAIAGTDAHSVLRNDALLRPRGIWSGGD